MTSCLYGGVAPYGGMSSCKSFYLLIAVWVTSCPVNSHLVDTSQGHECVCDLVYVYELCPLCMCLLVFVYLGSQSVVTFRPVTNSVKVLKHKSKCLSVYCKIASFLGY